MVKAFVALLLAVLSAMVCAEWDYMAAREQLEAGMSDEERDYLRAHAQSEATANQAFMRVYAARRANRPYLDAGPAKSIETFAHAGMRDPLMLVGYFLITLLARRWVLSVLLCAAFAAVMWAALRNTGPWGPVNLWILWGQVAASAVMSTAFCGALRAVLALRRPAGNPAG
jgi:hypothetical protein